MKLGLNVLRTRTFLTVTCGWFMSFARARLRWRRFRHAPSGQPVLSLRR